MISKKLQDAINTQINKELYSEYLYLSMRAWFAQQSLDGFANWMDIQTQEEHAHAMKFFAYVIERGGKIELEAIEKPAHDFESPIKAFQITLEHESYVSSSINGLMDIAISENDHAARSFLQWFVEEQVEEEANADRILSQLKMIGERIEGVLMLDRELAKRVFVPITPAN